MSFFAHPTAEISSTAEIGDGTMIWNFTHVRESAQIGEECIIGKNAYIDAGAIVGNRVKIQNNCSVYKGVTLEDGVFVGPHVCFTNDLFPRAIRPDGQLKSASDWKISPTLVCHGASIGANSTIRCGIRIGCWAMIGAGSTVVHDVPDYCMVVGNPAKLLAHVCPCGGTLREDFTCSLCSASLQVEITAAEKQWTSKRWIADHLNVA